MYLLQGLIVFGVTVERVYLPLALPPTPLICARLSSGGRFASPREWWSWSYVFSLIRGSALPCFAAAGLPFDICAYAVPPDIKKAVAAAIATSFIGDLLLALPIPIRFLVGSS